jgi:hypothetical protein
MAEFKLGRIRFVWKGNWTTATAYYKDDVVRYGGKTYICQVGHTSDADFNTDLEYSPTKWNQMTDGQEWTGDWTTSQFYRINDVVKYGGLLYICNDSHTSASTVSSGLEADQAKWTLFSEGFDWQGDWTVSTRYKKNDLVRYGGYTYLCNTGHTSAATTLDGLEVDQAKWDTFNPGTEYLGTWTTSTRYKINDIVKYGAGLWICITEHTATSFSADQSNWAQYVEGFEFESEWNSGTTYQNGDIVRYGGNQYIAKTIHSSEIPSTSSANWDLFTEGFNFSNDWSSVTAYRIGDVVRLNGYTYLATADSTNQEPPNVSYWQKLNSGIAWQGEWVDDVEYKLGDAVRFGTNNYICILGHRSEGDDGSTIGPEGGGAANSRPDQDTTGTYWNLLSIGTETDILSVRGDLVYYGGSGPTRLPIGTEGQVLRAGTLDPEWVTLGDTDHVYYVSTNGTDLPAPIWGKTVDKPWKTIRYACEQVEKGPRNPNAQYLLELNRAFIQREVTEWIQYQITNDIAPFTTAFVYDDFKCERDTGYIVDALVYDLGHGGNVKSRGAANSYVNGLSESERETYLKLSEEKEEDVAAFNYMLTVVQSVLNQEAPAVNYQTTNGDNSTTVVAQYFNSDIEAESGTYATCESLVGIITDAITAGNADNIPARSAPNNLIQVATGRYREVLPIIVPEQTCVIGDELRSTNAGPREGTTPKEDSFFTKLSLDRLSLVAQDVVQGSTVTPTTGNTETQNQAWPYAGTDEASDISDIIGASGYNIKFRTGYNLFPSNTASDPTNYNTSYLTGYGDARYLIRQNKEYLKAEVTAYITQNYPNLKYSRTKCKQDVGYIVDAMVYDLTYGGNAMSVQAGLAYWEGVTRAIDSSELSATLASYAYLKTIMQSVASAVTGTSINTTISRYTAGTAASAGAISFIGSNMDEMIDIITNGTGAASLTDPSTSWVSGALTSAYSTLDSAVATIKTNTTSYISTNFPSLTYDSAKCERDVGIILKAVGYDFMFNTQFQTELSGRSYLRSTASEVFSLGQKTATRAALEYVRTQAIANVGGDTDAIARINASMELIDHIIFSGSIEGSRCASEERTVDYAVLQLERNRDFLIAEINAYIADTFKSTITDTTSGTNVLTISAGLNQIFWDRNVAVKFTGTTFGGITANTTYYIQYSDGGNIKIATSKDANTALSLSTASGSMTMELVYNEALCERDMQRWIDALKHDLKYPGNYRTQLCSRFYANAVVGSLEEDMFYLRDGTGLRDMTLEGLTGDMLPENEYGTSRVSAGAYASLDPGWGPEDYRVWIINRSPYVQGITTIGTGAIGQKIDGALHNGGNDSIVSNDFTQVISDGIGAWVANNGRAELVSVFTYYAHIGYLCTEGGRIRGTNGNNSYGDFGSVAEGFDATETPNTAVVDNKFQFVATVGSVITNGSAIWQFEFDNAGIDYTEVNWTLTGGGSGAVAVADEFRDGGVYQIRLLDLGDDSSGQFGGEGYLTNSNTAQGGTSTQITLAATDPQGSTDYIGMKVFLTGGAGVGQVGIIDTYNSGTKVATVTKESDGTAGWDHVIPGTTIVSPDASSTYTVEPRVTFAAPALTATATTLPSSGFWQNAAYGETTATYTGLTGTYSGSGLGATFTVIRNGWKYIPSVQSAGTGYTRLETITITGNNLGGTTPANNLVITITAVNSVTGAIIDFDYDGFGSGGVFVAVRQSGTNLGAYSSDGSTWSESTSLPAATWTGVTHGLIDDGSSLQKISKFVAVSTGTSNIAAYSSDGINWTASTLPSSVDWVSVAYGGGRFVAVDASGASAVSLDGEIWDYSGTVGHTCNEVAYGRGIFVAIGQSGTDLSTSTDGVTWTLRTLPASATWRSVVWGNNKFVAVNSTSNDGAYSFDGITWTAMTIGSADGSTVAGLQKVRYGQGLFVAAAYRSTETGYSFVITSEDGISWNEQGLPDDGGAVDGYKGLAFGNPQRVGTWVALEAASGTHAVRLLTGTRAKGRAFVSENKIFAIRITEPGSGYTSAPTMTITDPNNTYEVPHTVRIGNGVLANPTFTNRGSQYSTGSAEVDTGDGYADFYQTGSFVAVRRLSARPVPGSNVVFSHLPSRTFKLVNVVTFLGSNDGSYTAFFQVSPALSISEAPEHLVGATTRIRYSQVRLTGHDFLDIGTGSFTETNYPGTPTQDPIPANETVENNGGRVFFTSTDQDGNFRVGELFAIEQSTGVATLNADAFNISGLQELNLGNVTLGGGSATITEFSTDPFFTADSDNIVPTQRAIKAYIASQIGGGGASLNVNSVTAGSIFISSNVITTTTGASIKMNAVFEFRGGVTGLPIAFNYFLQ